MITSQKLGRFIVSQRDIDLAASGNCDMRAGLCALFGKCIIVWAEARYDRRCVEYAAFCEDFEEVPMGVACPVYNYEISRIEDNIRGQSIVTFDVKFTKEAR